MATNIVSGRAYIALLSAASASEVGVAGTGGALQTLAGRPLIEWQILALRDCGVKTFLIEVDTVSGVLLGLADSLRHSGLRVEFVRSTKDLQSFLKPGDLLVVQAEAHYFSRVAVDEFVGRAQPFIATVDGREENTAFERIDLNTRWAGFALLDIGTAGSLTELPQGWSITSSLLRHAIQCGVKFVPVAQGYLQNSDVARVSGQIDADRLVDRMLAGRIGSTPGFIEKNVVGKIARRAARSIWAARSGMPILRWTTFVGAAASIGCGMMGWTVAAAATALAAISLHIMREMLHGFGETGKSQQRDNLAFWAMIIGAAFSAAWTNADYGTDVGAFATMFVGLAILAHKMALPPWANALLKSPALLAFAVLIAASFSAFAPGAKIIALLQIGLLIAGVYLPRLKPKNPNQA
jgi:hypothetical protein